VQPALKCHPDAGDLYVFRGRGQLIKLLWHDGVGMSLRQAGWSPAGLSALAGRRDGGDHLSSAGLLLERIVWTPSAGQERYRFEQSCRLRVCVWPVRAATLPLMGCPPPEVPISISRLVAHPLKRAVFGRRSDRGSIISSPWPLVSDCWPLILVLVTQLVPGRVGKRRRG
jgi:transposase